MSVYAGRECARALAKGSKERSDVGSADLSGCSDSELARLDAAEAQLRERHDAVGQVGAAVPGQQLCLQREVAARVMLLRLWQCACLPPGPAAAAAARKCLPPPPPCLLSGCCYLTDCANETIHTGAAGWS